MSRHTVVLQLKTPILIVHLKYTFEIMIFENSVEWNVIAIERTRKISQFSPRFHSLRSSKLFPTVLLRECESGCSNDVPRGRGKINLHMHTCTYPRICGHVNASKLVLFTPRNKMFIVANSIDKEKWFDSLQFYIFFLKFNF